MNGDYVMDVIPLHTLICTEAAVSFEGIICTLIIEICD